MNIFRIAMAVVCYIGAECYTHIRGVYFFVLLVLTLYLVFL